MFGARRRDLLLEGIQTRKEEAIERDRKTRLADRLADEEALKAWTEAGGL